MITYGFFATYYYLVEERACLRLRCRDSYGR